jgi:hypothetical protein
MAQSIKLDAKMGDGDANIPDTVMILPVSEIGQDVEVGQHGVVSIPVEVIQVKDGMVSLRKAKPASSDSWRQKSLADMESEIGTSDESDR